MKLHSRRHAFVAPMCCLAADALPEGGEWLYEAKWDGYRAIGAKHREDACLYSRHGSPFDIDFPEINRSLLRLRCQSAVVDGELICLDDDGQPSFAALQETSMREGRVRFVLFDLLMVDGVSVQGRSLMGRRSALEAILPRDATTCLQLSPELKGESSFQLLATAKDMSTEGVIAKRRNSCYEPGLRPGTWIKCYC